MKTIVGYRVKVRKNASETWGTCNFSHPSVSKEFAQEIVRTRRWLGDEAKLVRIVKKPKNARVSTSYPAIIDKDGALRGIHGCGPFTWFKEGDRVVVTVTEIGPYDPKPMCDRCGWVFSTKVLTPSTHMNCGGTVK